MTADTKKLQLANVFEHPVLLIIGGGYLNQVRFEDDIVIIWDDFEDAIEMIKDQQKVTQRVRLKMIFQKTNTLTNFDVSGEIVTYQKSGRTSLWI